MESPTVHLNDIGQIALTVANLEEAKTFYRDVLGMPFLFEAGTMAFFQCGSVRLLLGTSPEPNAQQSSTILFFRVRDIHAACAALKAKGVAFLHEPHLVAKMQDHNLWIAFFRDPSGHTLALMSEVPRAESE